LAKILNVVSKNIYGANISNTIQIEAILASIKPKQLAIKFVGFEQALDMSSDADLIIHNFNDLNTLPENFWQRYLKIAKKPIIVFPTELSDKKTMSEHFSNNMISKIIVASDCYQKVFTKTLKINADKIKLVTLGSAKLPDKTINKKPRKLILTPALLNPEKDFNTLLETIEKLVTYYPNLSYTLLLRTHPRYTNEQNDATINNLYKQIDFYHLNDIINVIIDSDYNYQDYLRVADLILLPPHKNKNKMYSGVIMDAIMAHKPIVAPTQPHAYDLCKNDIGIFLYQPDKPQTILECCSIILDRTDITDILEQQNIIASQNFEYNKITSQFMNIIRKII
jgi:glycosyltransferase involved in cell wall biosynthesis